MSRFLERYWPLIIGLALPLLLVLFVLLIQVSSRWNAPLPTTPVLYWPDADYWLRPQVSWTVEEGGLELSYLENTTTRANQADQSIRLWLYRPASGQSESFDIELPDGLEDRQRVSLVIPDALAQLSLDDAPISPEGYRFEVSSGGGRGLFAELFGGYRSRREYQLVGHGIRHALPEQGSYMVDRAFLAWVVSEGQGGDQQEGRE
jgi:hypothetical protein